MAFPMVTIIGIVIIPFISAVLNVYINRLFLDKNDDIIKCLIVKVLYDYIVVIVQQDITWRQMRILYDKMLLRINMAKIKCGTPIPGANLKQYKDLINDASKLREFLSVLPLLWQSITSFAIMVYSMESSSEYPVRIMFAAFCVIACGVSTYFTDPSLYNRTKPSVSTVTSFNDSNYVKLKLSLSCDLDLEFELKKREKMDKQQNLQKYIILCVNLILTYISLASKSFAQLYSFSSISWMIGCLADHIKGLKYYTFVDEFLSFCETLEKHKLECLDIDMVDALNLDINRVSFVNASFGYYSDDLQCNPKKIQKITNLSYTFNRGEFYYIEAPNGTGKSTIMKMFQNNLFSGNVYFGSVNRKQLSFCDICSNIFHVVQATEYTPQFTKDEVNNHRNRDTWLEERLCLEQLFDKDTVEMSGGEKKRMFIYMVLTSNCPIILLDEILSELSTEETEQVPEGGGWLTRVINTLVNWNGNKIIILVGHGLLSLIPDKQNIIKLQIDNTQTNTYLKERK